MVEVVIGGTKSARQGFSFEEVAIAPQRRTRDASEVSTSWNIDAYKFDTPFIAAPMDSVVSPDSAVTISRNGALAVLNLEGLWGRYENPTIFLHEIAQVDPDQATALQLKIVCRKTGRCRTDQESDCSAQRNWNHSFCCGVTATNSRARTNCCK